MYSAKDLISIIKQCGKSGVKTFKAGQLELEFLDTGAEVVQNLSSLKYETKEFTPAMDADPEYVTLSEDEQKEILLISDPGKWEREILAKESEETFHVGASQTL